MFEFLRAFFRELFTLPSPRTFREGYNTARKMHKAGTSREEIAKLISYEETHTGQDAFNRGVKAYLGIVDGGLKE